VIEMKPRDITIADLMSTNVVTVSVNDTLGEAHAEMEIGLIRHLPVVDERGRLVGVLSDRDLKGSSSRKPRRVADVMTRDLLTRPARCSWSTSRRRWSG
jgi:CBS domain-containing protein